jgi:hypothetical protein
MTWKHVQRGGYGYLLLTPCRIVKQGPKRTQIATPLRDGGERLRWVPREKLFASDREALA